METWKSILNSPAQYKMSIMATSNTAKMDQEHGNHGLLLVNANPAPGSLENSMAERRLRSMKLN